MGPVTIFQAKSIHTMDLDEPSASAVAVDMSTGRIVALGTADELISDLPTASVDTTFAEKTLLPGFVEAHAHRLTGGLWAFPYVGYFDRHDQDGRLWPGCPSIDAVVEALIEADVTMADPTAPLIAWGLDPIYFAGERLVAHHLDRVSLTRPIFVLHASAHLATVNAALMEASGIGPQTDAPGVPKDDDGMPIGELQELVAMALAGDIGFQIIAESSKDEATWRFAQVAVHTGVTTLTDLGTTNLVDSKSVEQLERVTADPDFPVRMSVALNPAMSASSNDELVDALDRLRQRSTPKMHLGIVKLILDGSIQGFTARLSHGSYYNGEPNGLWLMAPEQVMATVQAFHEAGATIHAHCNGDEATEVFLDAVEAAQDRHPRNDHRHTVQHCQLATPEQFARMARLGMTANLFSNHVYFWGDQHAALTVGPQKAAEMNAAASAIAAGVPFSIHSDSPVTPLSPLHVAWCAVNRLSSSGKVMGADECISVDQALHAITAGAAYQLRLEDDLGTIAAGKFADFAVLDADPYEVDPVALKDIPVWGTVLAGVPHPAAN